MGIARVLSGVNGADLGTGAPFGPEYAAGVTVASGDVTGDGRADVITGTAVGGFVRVFDGVDYSPVASGFPYGSIYAGGVAVAAGDFDGDARADIAVAPLNGSAPAHVFIGADLRVLGSAPPFPGASGMTVAVADVNDDGQMDLILGAGPGSPPHVKAFSGSDGAELISAYAFEPTFHGGVFVAGLARGGVRFTRMLQAIDPLRQGRRPRPAEMNRELLACGMAPEPGAEHGDERQRDGPGVMGQRERVALEWLEGFFRELVEHRTSACRQR